MGLQGDELPKAVAAYYDAMDRNDHGLLGEVVRADAVVALPALGTETDPRRVLDTAALVAMVASRDLRPLVHDVRICGVEGSDCVLEGVLVDRATGEDRSTFVASVQLDPEGRISRYLAYSCDQLVEQWAGDAGPGVTVDAAELTDRYFHNLDAGEFEAAANCFSVDTLYSHPPYRHTGITKPGRVEFRGREELLAAFGTRGKQSFGHDIVAKMQRGRHYLFEGTVEGLPNDSFGSFISVLTVGDDGLAARYVSFFCEPGVRRR